MKNQVNLRLYSQLCLLTLHFPRDFNRFCNSQNNRDPKLKKKNCFDIVASWRVFSGKIIKMGDLAINLSSAKICHFQNSSYILNFFEYFWTPFFFFNFWYFFNSIFEMRKEKKKQLFPNCSWTSPSTLHTSFPTPPRSSSIPSRRPSSRSRAWAP